MVDQFGGAGEAPEAAYKRCEVCVVEYFVGGSHQARTAMQVAVESQRMRIRHAWLGRTSGAGTRAGGAAGPATLCAARRTTRREPEQGCDTSRSGQIAACPGRLWSGARGPRRKCNFDWIARGSRPPRAFVFVSLARGGRATGLGGGAVVEERGGVSG